MHRADIRNVAIIAHVDHGKTTLVDAMLRQSGTFKTHEQVRERVMDSGDLERERGITILAKNTAIEYKDVKINIVDTPGHADFGGEVERILGMVDGVILVVDAFEGPMPQTRYVLRKALAQGLKALVVINKIDRPDARPEAVVDEVIDLFISLIADDNQLDFPVLYASARRGVAGYSPDDLKDDISPIFEAILKTVPPPLGDENGPLQIGISTLDYDEYVGRLAVGKIIRGTAGVNRQVLICKSDAQPIPAKISGLFTFSGLKRKEERLVKAGELVSLIGLEDINIGDTVCDVGFPDPLDMIKVDEPTLSMNFLVNNSPFAGREGQYVTSRHLRDRLFKETEKNVSLRVTPTDSPDSFEVAGRGELHLSILIETMRREGYEMQISKPKVLTKTVDGILLEPIEYLMIDLPEEHMGAVMELLGPRKAEMKNMHQISEGHVRIEFTIPARGLIGFRSDFLTVTKGYGIMNHVFHNYEEYKGEIGGRSRGVLVAWEDGLTTSYALYSLQDRGILFVDPGLEVYKGMVVGENSRDDDMDVNVCKKKHITNMRAAGSDEALRLEPPRKMSLEQAMEYIADDELVEITPKSIRLRKKVLDYHQRMKQIHGKK